MPSRRHFLQLAGAGTAASLTAGTSFAQPPAPARTPHTSELALASYTLRSFPLDKVWGMTKRAGLKHICLHPILLPVDSTPEQIAKAAAAAKAAGLDLYAVGVIYTGTAEAVGRAFEYAKALGVRMIVGVPSHQLLPLVNEKVQQFDIRFAVHNHGPGDKQYPTADVAYEKIKNLDRRVGLCLDIGHTVRSGADPSQAVVQFADRLLDVHIKDINVAAAKGVCVEAGRGVIDLPKFLRTVDKVGYTGMLSFEYEKDSRDPLPGLAESVGYVRGIRAVI